MFPYKSNIKINKSGRRPLYLQIADSFIQLIKSGRLAKGTKLPGTRQLAELLDLHRKTVVAAYEELQIQDWIVAEVGRGSYVNHSLPLVATKVLEIEASIGQRKITMAGFDFPKVQHAYAKKYFGDTAPITITDGVPDVRLAPAGVLGTLYRSVLSDQKNVKYLNYGSTYGHSFLREAYVAYLSESRGLNIDVANILLTRGSQMSMFLASQVLLQNGGDVVVGQSNYYTASLTFELNGGTLIRIPVDDAGISTDALEELCATNTISMVYVTSHHHHPTTVTLSAQRRMQLLKLAQKYQFAVLEDDYDYDFHYDHAPILPLASGDYYGNVIYVGALCKIVAPAFRNGYLIAAKDFVEEAALRRTFVDRQSDFVSDMVFAKFIKEGHLERHTKYVHKIYKQRRNLFCNLLNEHLAPFLDFKIPDGGMAVWTTLKDEKLSWEIIHDNALKQGLKIPSHQVYNFNEDKQPGIRMGFASLNDEEMEKAILILKALMMSES